MSSEKCQPFCPGLNVSKELTGAFLICCLFQMLDENNQLIQAIIDFQSKGNAQDCVQWVDWRLFNLIVIFIFENISVLLQEKKPPKSTPMTGFNPHSGTQLDGLLV